MGKKVKDEEQKTSGKGKFIIILVLLLVVIGAGTFGGVYLFLQSKDAEIEKVETTNYVLLTEATLNLSDESGKAYLKTSLSIAYDIKNKDIVEEIEKKKINIQDAAIWYLKGKKSEDFSAENEASLKQGLIEAINNNLETGKVLEVFLVGEDGAGFLVQKA